MPLDNSQQIGRTLHLPLREEQIRLLSTQASITDTKDQLKDMPYFKIFQDIWGSPTDGG